VTAIGKWYADKSFQTFYGRKNFWRGGRCFSIKMHAFILGIPFADHANGNGLDNRRENLRPADATTNAWNRPRKSDNTSGYKGVSWDRKNGNWRAYITANGSRRHLGRFATAELAAAAYDVAAREIHGQFARLNFPAGYVLDEPTDEDRLYLPYEDGLTPASPAEHPADEFAAVP